MSFFSKNLRALRSQDNVTQLELAEALGISKSAVSMYERGEREPSFELLEAIADYFNVDMSCLLGVPTSGVVDIDDFDEMFYKRYKGLDSHGKELLNVVLNCEMDRLLLEQLERETKAPTSNNVIQVSFSPVRYSEQAASAGTGVYLDDESMATIMVRTELIPKGECFVVPVAGDSMEPRFHDGDILMVSKVPVNVGEIGVFTMDGQGYVKQLGRGVLHSLNHHYDDIPLTEDIICNGKVVGALDQNDIGEE